MAKSLGFNYVSLITWFCPVSAYDVCSRWFPDRVEEADSRHQQLMGPSKVHHFKCTIPRFSCSIPRFEYKDLRFSLNVLISLRSVTTRTFFHPSTTRRRVKSGCWSRPSFQCSVGASVVQWSSTVAAMRFTLKSGVRLSCGYVTSPAFLTVSAQTNSKSSLHYKTIVAWSSRNRSMDLSSSQDSPRDPPPPPKQKEYISRAVSEWYSSASRLGSPAGQTYPEI